MKSTPQIRAGGVHALRKQEGSAATHDDEGHGPRREGGACMCGWMAWVGRSVDKCGEAFVEGRASHSCYICLGWTWGQQLTKHAPKNFQLTPALPSIIPTPTMPPTMHCELELGRPCVSVLWFWFRLSVQGWGWFVSQCVLVWVILPPNTPHAHTRHMRSADKRTHPLRRDEDDERGGQLGGEATGRGQACHLRAHGLSAVVVFVLCVHVWVGVGGWG